MSSGFNKNNKDMSYWLKNLPDKRAISFWIAMDGTTKENGCMRFVKRSNHDILHDHVPACPGKHVLQLSDMNVVKEGDVEICELSAGEATLHGGMTIHGAFGNTTNKPRRGYIGNLINKIYISKLILSE